LSDWQTLIVIWQLAGLYRHSSTPINLQRRNVVAAWLLGVATPDNKYPIQQVLLNPFSTSRVPAAESY